jgi:hypothetical protein
VPGTVRGGGTSTASRISFRLRGAEVARAGVNAQAAADQMCVMDWLTMKLLAPRQVALDSGFPVDEVTTLPS